MKKIILSLTVISAVALYGSVFAQDPVPFYFVYLSPEMKALITNVIFLILFCHTAFAAAYSDSTIKKRTIEKKGFSIPSQQGWITDWERDLDSTTKATLIEMAMQHQM